MPTHTDEDQWYAQLRKLFEKLNDAAGSPGIKYDVVTSYDQLLQLVRA